MKELILQHIRAECPWRDTLRFLPVTDSTNLQAKLLARAGAPHGTVIIAGGQTAGRGRLGRYFDSRENMGVYLSVILRPNCSPETLMHLTCAVGTAMCDAVRSAAGFTPGLKWINDLVFEKRKLGGILTELSVDQKTGLTEWVVVGIGINCLQKQADFPPQLQEMAVSLSAVAGRDIPPALLAGKMVNALWKMDQMLFTGKKQLMERYRSLCVTLGQDIQVIDSGRVRAGKAVDMDDDGGLWVQYTDGSRELVSTGEVSVRGMYGYL